MSGITKQELDPELVEEIGISGKTPTPIETTINRGLQVVTVPLETPVNVLNFTGKTVINYAPLFDSGAWDKGIAPITVNSPSKATLVATDNSQSMRLDVPVKEGQIWTYSHKGNGYVIVEGTSSIVPATKDKLKTFTIPTGVSKISIYLTNLTDTTATYFWEDFMLNKGATAQEFVSNVKGVTNPTITRKTRNLIKPIVESQMHVNATKISDYVLRLDSATEQQDLNEVAFLVKPSATYTFSMAKLPGIFCDILLRSATDDFTYLTTINDGSNDFYTFATKSDTEAVVLNFYSAIGEHYFKNFMLHEGATPIPFEPYHEESLTVQGTFYDGDIVNADKGSVERRNLEIVLDGSLDWIEYGKGTGFKIIRTSLSNSKSAENITVKYNGKILPVDPTVSVPDVSAIDINYGLHYITVPNIDSGWGETYTPTKSEVQAYMYGWRMFNNGTPAVNGIPVAYDGAGVKAWHRWDAITGAYVDIQNILPTFQAPVTVRWQPYRLIYELANPVTDSIKTIGSLSLSSGNNDLELTEGRIVRERVYPKIYTGNGKFHIGVTKSFDAQLDDPLKFVQSRILKIYKNGEVDPLWSLAKDIGPSFIEYAYTDGVDFDPTAIYDVEYAPQEMYKVSSQATPITIEYQDTLGGVSKALVNDLSQLEIGLDNQQQVLESVVSLAKASGGDFAKAYGLGTVAHNLGSGHDLNNVTGPLASSGLFMGESFLNSGFGVGWAFIVNMRHNGLYGKQVAHVFTGENSGKIYERIQNNGTWLPWKEAGGSGGEKWELIATVDARNFASLLSFSPSGNYDKLRMDFDAVGFQDTGSKSIVIYINGVTDANAYSGTKMTNATSISVANYGMQTSTLTNASLVTGSVYIERRGSGEGSTNEGLITIEGATAIANKGVYTATTVDYHRGSLKQNRNIISLMVGLATTTGIFNAGKVHLWGVRK